MNAWLITRLDTVVQALSSPELFSSVRAEKVVNSYVDRKFDGAFGYSLYKPLLYKMAHKKMSPFVDMAKLFMWQLDPPEHTRLRKLMHIGYTTKQINRFKPIIQNRTMELIDNFSDSGRCEFMDSFAVPLPAMIIADIYGMFEHWEELHELENYL